MVEQFACFGKPGMQQKVLCFKRGDCQTAKLEPSTLSTKGLKKSDLFGCAGIVKMQLFRLKRLFFACFNNPAGKRMAGTVDVGVVLNFYFRLFSVGCRNC